MVSVISGEHVLLELSVMELNVDWDAAKEIQDYLRAVDLAKARRPTKAEVKEKEEAISKVNQFVYSASAVKLMLQEKKQAASRPVNIALEKDRVIKELGIAETKGDLAEVEKLQSRLKELEVYATRVKSKDAKAMALAEMNRRNRYKASPDFCGSFILFNLVPDSTSTGFCILTSPSNMQSLCYFRNLHVSLLNYPKSHHIVGFIVC